MRGILAGLAAVFFLPLRAAHAGVLLGTEDLPELPDAAGDMVTNPPFDASDDYLDLTAGWLEYDDKSDSVVATIRVKSSDQVESARPGFKVGCRFEGDITRDGQDVGNLTIAWRRNETGGRMQTWVIWLERTSAATYSGINLRHQFAHESGTPGYFRFTVPRTELVKLGDQFENPAGACAGFVETGAGSGPNFAGVVLAGDDAASKAAYSFVELRQSRTVGGEVLDPVERFERENGTAIPSTTSQETDSSGTPFLGASLVGLAVAVAVAIRRKSA